MSIIMNEYEWVEEKLMNPELGNKPVDTLGRISKYYIANGYSKKDLRKELDKYIMQCRPSDPLVAWSDILDAITKSAGRYPIIKIDYIDISKPEMNKIDSMNSVQVRRLAFTLLCVCKYWDNVIETNNHWVNTQDTEIMKMANINTSIKRQSMLYSALHENGMIRFSKKVDNLNTQVLFTEEGELALRITDMRNLGYQYIKYHGGNFIECANCGITVKINNKYGRKPKYCDACAEKVSVKQRIDSVMRHRDCEKVSYC